MIARFAMIATYVSIAKAFALGAVIDLARLTFERHVPHDTFTVPSYLKLVRCCNLGVSRLDLRTLLRSWAWGGYALGAHLRGAVLGCDVCMCGVCPAQSSPCNVLHQYIDGKRKRSEL